MQFLEGEGAEGAREGREGQRADPVLLAALGGPLACQMGAPRECRVVRGISELVDPKGFELSTAWMRTHELNFFGTFPGAFSAFGSVSLLF